MSVSRTGIQWLQLQKMTAEAAAKLRTLLLQPLLKGELPFPFSPLLLSRRTLLALLRSQTAITSSSGTAALEARSLLRVEMPEQAANQAVAGGAGSESCGGGAGSGGGAGGTTLQVRPVQRQRLVR